MLLRDCQCMQRFLCMSQEDVLCRNKYVHNSFYFVRILSSSECWRVKASFCTEIEERATNLTAFMAGQILPAPNLVGDYPWDENFEEFKWLDFFYVRGEFFRKLSYFEGCFCGFPVRHGGHAVVKLISYFSWAMINRFYLKTKCYTFTINIVYKNHRLRNSWRIFPWGAVHMSKKKPSKPANLHPKRDYLPEKQFFWQIYSLRPWYQRKLNLVLSIKCW